MTLSSAASRIGVSAAVFILLASLAPATAQQNRPDSQIEQQRELFRGVFESVERGDWTMVDALSALDRQLLEQYILWPDLRATWLRANVDSASTAEIDAFVQQYGTLRPVRELRYRHALNFVRKDDLSGYLKLYEQFYQGQNIEKLDCLALQAEISAGRHQRVEIRAVELWMVGKSQVSECDPVFEYLLERSLLGLAEYRQRYNLAVAARNFTLAAWLAEQIDQQHVEQAAKWLQAQTNPEDFLRHKWRRSGDAALREQLVYAAERLTFRDPEIARELWGRVSGKHKFSATQKILTTHFSDWKII